MRGDRFVARRRHDHVRVRRAIRMSSHSEQHLADGAIGGNRIAHRLDGPESVASLAIRFDLTARTQRVAVSKLYVIRSFSVGRPQVEHRTSNGFAARTEYAAREVGRL